MSNYWMRLAKKLNPLVEENLKQWPYSLCLMLGLLNLCYWFTESLHFVTEWFRNRLAKSESLVMDWQKNLVKWYLLLLTV